MPSTVINTGRAAGLIETSTTLTHDFVGKIIIFAPAQLAESANVGSDASLTPTTKELPPMNWLRFTYRKPPVYGSLGS